MRRFMKLCGAVSIQLGKYLYTVFLYLTNFMIIKLNNKNIIL